MFSPEKPWAHVWSIGSGDLTWTENFCRDFHVASGQRLSALCRRHGSPRGRILVAPRCLLEVPVWDSAGVIEATLYALIGIFKGTCENHTQWYAQSAPFMGIWYLVFFFLSLFLLLLLFIGFVSPEAVYLGKHLRFSYNFKTFIFRGPRSSVVRRGSLHLQ